MTSAFLSIVTTIPIDLKVPISTLVATTPSSHIAEKFILFVPVLVRPECTHS